MSSSDLYTLTTLCLIMTGQFESHQTRTHFNRLGDWMLKLCAVVCSVVIRMARIFGLEALPTDGSMCFPTAGASPSQRDIWSLILKSSDDLSHSSAQGAPFCLAQKHDFWSLQTNSTTTTWGINI